MKKNGIIKLAVIFLLNILLIYTFQAMPAAQAASYKIGSSGDTVKTIQEKLIRWGYLEGTADGVFGSKTEAAVKKFQQKNGLTADGVVGSATLKALGMSDAAGSSSSGATSGRADDLYLLGRIISAEARGEPYQGQVAVGAVVLNRVKHPSFPGTVAGVVYQKGAFSAVDDGQFDQPISDTSRRAAQDALNGMDPSGGAIYYYNPAKATSKWIWSRPIIKTIGSHVFCT